MDLEALYGSCMEGDRDEALTPSMVYTFVRSPFSAWCEIHAPEEEKDPIDHFRRLLFEQGRRHEAELLQDLYPDIEPISWDTPEEGFRYVLEFMASGGSALGGAPLFYLPERIWGVMDLIERVDGAGSTFGPYHYVVKEVKSAKNIRRHHRLQAACSNYLLGRVQEYTPREYCVLDRDREERWFEYDEEDEEEVLGLLEDLRALHEGAKTDAVYGGGEWPWESYNDRVAIENRDISLVHGVGGGRREGLIAAGYETVEALARAPEGELTKVQGIGSKTATKIRRRADALARGKCIRIGDVTIPGSETEIFFDLEGTAQQALDGEHIDMDYMIGALIRRDGEEEFRVFVAEDVDREEEMFREFVDWFSRLDDCVAFHWHRYENRRLRRMADAYGLDPELGSKLFGSFFDLHRAATRTFAFPTYSNSIKDIAKFMGYEWKHSDVSATEAIGMYYQYVRGDGEEELLDKIVDYNRDDCAATRVVKDWLVERAAQETSRA